MSVCCRPHLSRLCCVASPYRNGVRTAQLNIRGEPVGGLCCVPLLNRTVCRPETFLGFSLERTAAGLAVGLVAELESAAGGKGGGHEQAVEPPGRRRGEELAERSALRGW